MMLTEELEAKKAHTLFMQKEQALKATKQANCLIEWEIVGENAY